MERVTHRYMDGADMKENEVLELLKSSKGQNNMVGILPGSDIGNTIIKALEEVQQYRALGTPEECRAAREKQIPKRPKEYEDKYFGCPTCGRLIDAEEFKNHIKEVIEKQNGKNIDLVSVGELLVFIDREPTAYDPNKVVEQLEDKMKELNEISKGVNMTKILERQNHGYYTAMEHAIEIVKGGGADDKSL